MKGAKLFSCLIIFVMVFSVLVSAEDWTQYGNDAGRKGKSNSFVPEFNEYDASGQKDEVAISSTASS
ncbi:hypothetical protein HYT58_02205, partial [Candidatus Woesearchaeota archaeon]|nr:hypothetical protein [Candidatus Woesearchaeota archaeon]